MKSLQEFLVESLVNESFASDTIRTLYFSLKPGARRLNSSDYYTSNSLPMWDKLTDNDITKLDKDEALKRMRSRKDPGYLIWFMNNGTTCCGITWGCDVCMTYDGYFKGVTASQVAYDADGAYEIKDVDKFIRNKLRDDRRAAKEGAVALMSYDTIKRDNLERYKKELAKLHNPGLDAVIKLYEDTMEIYKNIVDKYVAKFVSIMQEGTGSYYRVADEWKKLNDLIRGMTDDMHMYAYSNGYHDDKNAMSYYKMVSAAAQKIEEIVNNFEASSK